MILMIIIIIVIIIITIIIILKKFLIPNTYMLDKLCYDMKYKTMSIPSLYFTFWKSLHKISQWHTIQINSSFFYQQFQIVDKEADQRKCLFHH